MGTQPGEQMVLYGKKNASLRPQRFSPLTPLPGVFVKWATCTPHTFPCMEQALVQLRGQRVTGCPQAGALGGLLQEGVPQPPHQRAVLPVPPPHGEFHPLRIRVFSVLQSLKEAGCCQLP